MIITFSTDSINTVYYIIHNALSKSIGILRLNTRYPLHWGPLRINTRYPLHWGPLRLNINNPPHWGPLNTEYEYLDHPFY